MLTLVILILIVVSLILLGSVAPKPIGWVVVGCAVLVLLLELFAGGAATRHGLLDHHKDMLRMADGR